MNRAASIVLSPLSGLYGATMQLRCALYRRGVFRTYKIPAKVISVGNLTTGGTGKTPLVEWIAKEFARRGNRVCVLTRGYGRENPGRRVVVSNGHEIVSTARVGGDEPLLLAERLRDIAAVICDADRVAGANWAIENLKSNLFILDDGFQHLRIARDFNLLVVDATNPWGNGRLLPAGILREPRREMTRADCVVITRVDAKPATDNLKREIERLSNSRPVFTSRMGVGGLRKIGSDHTDAADAQPLPLAAFCAIGNPKSFFDQLHRNGYQVVHTKAFRDHHIYRQGELDQLISESTRRGAQALITTAKDDVKVRTLKSSIPCFVVHTQIEIDEKPALMDLIDTAIRD